MALFDKYYVELQANEFKPAGVTRRIIAFSIDLLICGGAWFALDYYGTDIFPYPTILEFVGLGMCILYFALLQRFSYGQTIGKRALSIAVMPKKGGILTWNQSLWRVPLLFSILGIWMFLLLFINSDMIEPLTSIFLIVNIIIIIFSRNKRGIHDYIFNTYVVKKKAQNIVTVDHTG